MNEKTNDPIRQLKIKAAFVIMVIMLLLVFTVQNMKMVEVNFLWWTFGLQRSTLVFLVFGLGIALGWWGRIIYRHWR